MAVINGRKIDDIKLMLRQYFNNFDPVTQEFLYAKVDGNTIRQAEAAGYISCQYLDQKYRIQQKGKVYRDS